MAHQLDIIIPQYNEDETKIKFLLNSIEAQVGIDHQYFQVTIVNDHSDCKLSADFLNSYDYKINYLETPVNGGAGLTRQYGLDHTSAPYVMFCDADDYFCDITALTSIMNVVRMLEVKKQPWSHIWSNFLEEYKKDKDYRLIEHNTTSMIWMHGKVWNRAFLVEKQIKFHPTLRTFEDTYFGKLVALSGPRALTIPCNHYTYFWKRNPNSVTAGWNHDGHSYMYWNYKDYITCNEGVVQFFKDKKIERQTELIFTTLIFTYFVLQLEEFNLAEDTNKERTIEARTAFIDMCKRVATEYTDIIEMVPQNLRARYYSACRNDCSTKFDFHMEKISWNKFLKEVLNLTEDQYKFFNID